MKKTISMLALAMLCLMPAFAQKRTIVLGQTTGSNVSSQWISALRNSILQGLTATNRLNVVDGSSMQNLSTQTATALTQLKETEAEYLMEAEIVSLTTSSETSSYTNKLSYKAKLEYAYRLYNVTTGEIIANERETHYGSSYDNYDAAINSSLSLVDNDIVKMVNSYFRVVAEIKAINESNPKKGVISVYVSAGSSDGVEKDNILEVFKLMEVAGEQITEKIGEMKVVEVKNANLSLCKVTKGGKELQEAMDNEVPIIIRTRPKNSFLGISL